MTEKKGAVTVENRATQVAREHNPSRARDVWKRIAMLGFGGGLAALIIGGLVGSGAIAGWGFLAGLGVVAAGFIGQGLSRK